MIGVKYVGTINTGPSHQPLNEFVYGQVAVHLRTLVQATCFGSAISLLHNLSGGNPVA